MIEPKFSPAMIGKQLRDKLKNIEAAIINRLSYIGETFVANARSTDTYKDQTGNLRSSIGYTLMKNGQPIKAVFNGKTVVGKAAGEKVAADVAAKHPKGFVLIVVAGMEYAAAVESKNYDVLTASSITAENDLRKAIAELKEKI